MATISFDTLKFSKSLKNHGFNEEQAEALTMAQKEAFEEVLSAEVASRSDLMQSETRLEKRLVRIEIMIALLYVVILIPEIKSWFI